MASTPLIQPSMQEEDTWQERKSASSLQESTLPTDGDSNDEANQQVASSTLYRNSWPTVLVATYAALAIFAWSILCILTYRPLTTKHYHSYSGRTVDLQTLYARNEGWLRTARVIQAILAVVTIPLTSTAFMWIAYMVIHETELRAGGVLSPLQSVFLRINTTKTPTSPKWITGISDIPHLVGDTERSGLQDLNLISILTRSAITTASSTDPQARLWTQGQLGCNKSSKAFGYDLPSSCSLGSVTLDNMTSLINPFIAHLPAQFATGLVKQFIPRMNSSAAWDNVELSEYPINCESLPGAFYVHYGHDGIPQNTNFAGNWSLAACMPTNQTVSPWQATRDRQDIVEHLYLNITINTFTGSGDVSAALYRITLNTTLGYFELPNYANGQVAVPLLDKSPLDTCVWHADTNLTTCVDNKQLPVLTSNYRRGINGDTAGMSNSSVALQATHNKGPLLLIAMALLGPDSFIANRALYPERFLINTTNTDMWNNIDAGADPDLFAQYCIDQEPMMGLLTGSSSRQDPEGNGFYPGCIRGSNNQLDGVHRQIEQWIRALTSSFPRDRIVNAFEAAAFLANEAWLVKGASRLSYPSLYVTYDLGSDTEVPVMSLAGLIMISILLCSYLIGLFTMAFYGSGKPVWTHDLNAFAMMRIGAAMSNKVSFDFANNADCISILDETSGCIGDGSGGQGPVGNLALGAPTPLTRTRRVHCYDET